MLWKMELKRNLFNLKSLIIIVILIILGITNAFFLSKEKKEYIKTYNANYEDVDQARMLELINNYNGIEFGLEFMLSSDFGDIYIIILFLFCGIFLSSQIRELIDSGQENFLLSRTTYKQHISSVILAQSVYIFTIVFITMIINLVINYIVGGIGSSLSTIGNYTINLPLFIVISIFQILIISVSTSLINAICLLSCTYIHKKIIIQLLPFLAFTIAPMFISSTIGNLINIIGEITAQFVPFKNLKHLYWLFQSEFDIAEIILALIPFIVYTIVFVLLYRNNVKHYSEDCI